MSREINTPYGKIVIDRQVIATLAGLAANECFGIVGMASNKFSDGIAELLKKEALHKGVEVKEKDNGLQITVNIVVGYGTKLSEVANNVISNVKYTVEKHTDLIVDHVQVNIQGVRMVD